MYAKIYSIVPPESHNLGGFVTNWDQSDTNQRPTSKRSPMTTTHTLSLFAALLIDSAR